MAVMSFFMQKKGQFRIIRNCPFIFRISGAKQLYDWLLLMPDTISSFYGHRLCHHDHHRSRRDCRHDCRHDCFPVAWLRLL